MSKNKYPIGYKFNKLTILEYIGKINDKHEFFYKCKCDCGNIINIRSNAINIQKSCGCKKRSYMGRKHKYPIGYKFNKLTIIEHLGKINKNNHQYYYKCKCDCGNIITIISGNINKQKSCGCRIYKYPVGYKFNKLTIISTGNKIDNKPFRYYKCKCDCGNIIYIRSNAINTQKSCGCSTTKYNIRYSYKTKV